MTTDNPTPQPTNTKARFDAERTAAGYKYLDSLRELMGVGQPVGEGPGLLPCPFCGEDPVYLTDFEDETQVATVHHVSCGLCPVQPGIYGRESKEEAFRLWNQRCVRIEREMLCAEHQTEYARFTFSGCAVCYQRDTAATPFDVTERARRAARAYLATKSHIVTSDPTGWQGEESRLADIIAAEFGGGGSRS